MTIQAWWEILGHIEFRDAMNGLLQHHRESTEYLMPAHIIKQARKAKREREREEQREAPLAIQPRTTPPANFREMIAEATSLQTEEFDPHPETGSMDLKRIQARLELQRMSSGLGQMP